MFKNRENDKVMRRIAEEARQGATNVYQDGKADARQDEGAPPPSLFRKRYRQLDPAEVALHDELKAKADELLALINKAGAPCSTYDLSVERERNRIEAVKHLEDAVYRAVKGLTA